MFWFIKHSLKCSENLFIRYVSEMHCAADLRMTSLIALDGFYQVTKIHYHNTSFFLLSFFLCSGVFDLYRVVLKSLVFPCYYFTVQL